MRAFNIWFEFAAGVALASLLATGAAAQGTAFPQIERGRYLVRAGDCVSCHTSPGGKPFAGGLGIQTPFGVIYSMNLTPDPETGIGNWSNADFYNAMHRGIDAKGQRLYPAFPYPWFTKLSRSDVDAIKAYLNVLEPVKQQNKPTGLPWPLSWRISMVGWNLLFFNEGEMRADAAKSAEWNRGAYLVEGAGHCAACHTPKNVLGASKGGQALQGGDAGNHWFAPSLSSDLRDGLGGWTVADIVAYLKTGSNAKAATAGAMTDVIKNSTQYLSDADLNAIAVYLKDMPAVTSKEEAKKAPLATSDRLARGEALYVDNCMGCHMADGGGIAKVFPPLKASAAIQAASPGTVIHVVMEGAKMATPATKPTGLTMPGFAGKLNDGEIAAVVNYIRNAWGNRASLVSVGSVAEVRASSGRSRTGDLTWQPGARVQTAPP